MPTKLLILACVCCSLFAAEPVRITSRLMEGETKILVRGEPSQSGENGTKTYLSLFIDEAEALLKGPENAVLRRVALDTNGFATIELQNPLRSGQVVRIEQKAGTDSPTNDVSNVQEPFDWGRARGTLGLGSVVSKDRNNFSQLDIFLGYNLDYSWRVPYPNMRRWNFDNDTEQDCSKGGQENKEPVRQPNFSPCYGRYGGRKRILVNAFFEGRLTAVPVQGVAKTETTANATTNTTIENFVSSEKAAEVISGFYMPVLFGQWNNSGSTNALYIAPLVKGGFITPTSTAEELKLRGVADGRFFSFWATGFRFGHYSMRSTRNVAPYDVSHIDVAFGKFANLPTEIGKLEGDDFVTHYRNRNARMWIEGQVRVPSTPVVLGVSANIGITSPSASGFTGAAMPIAPGDIMIKRSKDDLRFFIGFKFDSARLFEKIRQP